LAARAMAASPVSSLTTRNNSLSSLSNPSNLGNKASSSSLGSRADVKKSLVLNLELCHSRPDQDHLGLVAQREKLL
jgi:hypothetical protein